MKTGPIRRILIANRGEVAVRIARAAHDLGIETVAVFADDDAGNPHRRAADRSLPLGAAGPAAYLDATRLLAAARAAECDAVHPGYGFLSERADFAGDCAAAGLVFIGPTPEQLAVFGDKARARELARRCGVPLLPGTGALADAGAAAAFMASLPPGSPVMVKAVAGGGGRGLRVVRDPADLPAAFERCRSEALAAFGVGEVFVERWLPRARHVEVQILGDGRDVVDFGERECSLQRRHQKLVEVAPSPTLEAPTRQALVAAALAVAREVGYRGLGTVEFLADTGPGADPPFAFLEVNARLQVEHTVTEQVTGMDLVAAQIAVADGRGLADLGLLAPDLRRPRGHAIQFRINAEVPQEDGSVRPAAGRIEGLHPASGPGIRVDAALEDGFAPSPAFDPLLAKLVVHSPSPDYADCVRRARRALAEFRIGGIATNLPWLAALAARDEFAANAVDTRFLEDHAMALAAAAGAAAPVTATESGGHVLAAPMAGRLVQVDVAPGDRVVRGDQVAVVEAMKMEHPVAASAAGRIVAVPVAAGDAVAEGQVLAWLEPCAEEHAESGGSAPEDPDRIRPDLQRLLDRNAFLADGARPEAVARRHAKGMRTARQNVADLCDPGSFVEYGALAIAAQRRRRPEADLIRETPADGLVAGIGTVNAAAFGEERARCLVMAYDYTVLAGTQGFMNHKKTDRLLRLAEEWELPIAFLAEGGGGRPGDTDMAVVTGLDVPTFASYARLSGRVPRIGVVAGHCFAGNAALLGCSDVIIATANASIGMGGPAMIEGGGLGVWRPEEVGPMDVQTKNGVVDVAVADEAEAVCVAKRYLSYFQGPLAAWTAADARHLRHLVPENRLRSYDVRAVIATLCDAESVLELRRDFGRAMVTALVRIEGRSMGLIANDSRVLSGAIDADAADKAARFLQLCDAFGLPVLSLCDTPGFMVGPETETRAQVRHVSRMFVAGAALSVPVFCLVLRKGYGLGAMAMAGGGFQSPFFVAAWPTGEFGAMGLEGAVRLGFRRELSAIADAEAREAKFRELVELAYAKGHGINVASYLEIDAVIDPAESRNWILRGLRSLPTIKPSRRWVDTW